MNKVDQRSQILNELTSYFPDKLAAEVWLDKYAAPNETHPKQMFHRLATELTNIEYSYYKKALKKLAYAPWIKGKLSIEGREYYTAKYSKEDLYRKIYALLDNFGYLLLGGSVMASLGLKNYSSLSNCFVIGQPEDSINGINLKRGEQANLMKRRGGVGKDLSLLRPKGALVNNAARTSTGAVSFMNVDSELTREIAQEGRRGALMLTLDIDHPDIIDFITSKQDLSRVTGANISVKISNNFMKCLMEYSKNLANPYYILRYPTNTKLNIDFATSSEEYNQELAKYKDIPENTLFCIDDHTYIKKVNILKLWELLIQCSWNTAEPGIMFKDVHVQYSPDGVYPQYRGVTTNPCFHPDTLIETVEGRKRIADITEPTYVYSMSREGNLCIIPSSAAFKTQLNAKTLKITLRNGSSIMVTPNHKMYIQDKGWVQAKHLQVGDRIAHILRSRRGRNLPEDLTTNFKSKFDNCIISIEEGQQTDVYDIQVPDTHCLIANNMVAHNCGEIFMQPYDSCRLIHHNLFSYIKNLGNNQYEFDFRQFRENAYFISLLADDIVDLEVQALDSIIEKIQAENNPLNTEELKLWQKLRDNGLKGRRCGIGITALADAIAYCGHKYGTSSALTLESIIFETKFTSELEAQADMAVLRGTFKNWDSNKEFYIDKNKQLRGHNQFYLFLTDSYSNTNSKLNLVYKLFKYGRRNVSWSTVAPTGSISILAGVTSGIEPLFLPYYIRSKKTTEDKFDYIDKNGDKFINYLIIHPKLKLWISNYCQVHNIQELDYNNIEEVEKYYKLSPYYQSCAADLLVQERIQIQQVAQRFTTHSISSTVNLCKDTSIADIARIYLQAFTANLKGITVYRDGCREGILKSTTSGNQELFPQYSAPKRPKVLQAELFGIKNKGQYYKIIVGLLDNKPYEVFATEVSEMPTSSKGTITKVKKHIYKWTSDSGEIIDNIRLMSDKLEERACTLYLSMLLRHGVQIPYIIKTAKKVDDNIASFTSAICRVLSKYVSQVKDFKEVCPECGQPLVREGGCIHCSSCSYSACMILVKK